MSLLGIDKNRRVIPRWRDYRTTIDTGELDSDVLGTPKQIDSGKFFEDKVQAWEENKSVEFAAELVAAALVLGRQQEARGAAKLILEPMSEATPAVKALAKLILTPADEVDRPSRPEITDVEINQGVLYLRIRSLRAQLNESPRNSLLWVDLSRAYAMLGQAEQSVRAMSIALKLVPANRFILRSASRLFVHLDEPDRADDLLRRNEGTRRDPWLLSAEIAVAAVAERTSPFIRTAKQILSSGSHAPWHITELASALATVELIGGSPKAARKLFRQSLTDPTENTVAQAVWASRKIEGVELTPDLLRTRRSFEARAVQYFHAGNWSSVVQQADNWLLDEPFSSRPAQLGSYVAAVGEQDFRLSEQFARRGLQANPDDPFLRNNLVVALANQGRLEEATRIFSVIPRSGAERIESTLFATEGLLHFRKGDLEAGRTLYYKSIENAKDSSLRRVRVMAALHLAREELLANTSQASTALQIAEAESKTLMESDILWMLQVLKNLSQAPRA